MFTVIMISIWFNLLCGWLIVNVFFVSIPLYGTIFRTPCFDVSLQVVHVFRDQTIITGRHAFLIQMSLTVCLFQGENSDGRIQLRAIAWIVFQINSTGHLLQTVLLETAHPCADVRVFRFQVY